MTEGDFFEDDATGVSANGGEFTVDPSAAGTGAVEIHTLLGDQATEVYYEVDPDGDGTYEVSVLVVDYGTEFLSQQNKIELSASANQRLRFVNTSGSAAAYSVTGVEIRA